MTEQVHKPSSRFRIGTVLVLVFVVPVILSVRAFDLHVTDKAFLQEQGDARALRSIPVAAHRGLIADRHGEPLAVSTPVDSIWAQPQQFQATTRQLYNLAKLLDLKPQKIKKLIATKKSENKEFVFLKRRINPSLAQKVIELEIPGLSLQREYRRYYPMGEVASHVVGFTNVDDIGQEGIELAYDKWLQGTDGSQLVMKDRLGRVIKPVDLIKSPHPGKDLVLSIDRRLQYLTYRELKRAVFEHKAKSGSAVILDVDTGEVLAMVNQPSFNPNNRGDLQGYRYRNRVVTDTFEPGSTVKPFTIAAALESGKYKAATIIDTTPGYLRVGSSVIRDVRNYGRLTLATVIEKSSNVGASKIALSIDPNKLVDIHQRVGFGDLTQSGLPGEVMGSLHQPRIWRDIERATLSYGYGLSVTTLQLARAYMVLANDGKIKPLSIQLQAGEVSGQQVLNRKHAKQIRAMLKGVVSPTGTGKQAAVPGFHVAGKTGTVKKVGKQGYSENKYVSTFVGMAPADNPQLVMAITIHEPGGEHYYGGAVAAPVFSKVMAGALRLLDIAPDDLPEKQATFAMLGGTQ
ncbi:MAG: penicillin-binding transpeptidase domain-containing protein [Thioalkalispiraceae bacterium]|jgi:cell division protein FtsI (penicillin-binding protein 3)